MLIAVFTCGWRMENLSARLVEHNLWLTSLGRKGVQLQTKAREFNELDLYGVVLSDVILPSSIFRNCELQQADFAKANLASVTFENCNLSGATFVKANLDYAVFLNCKADGTVFFRTSLYSAEFVGTALDTANMEKAYTYKIKNRIM